MLILKGIIIGLGKIIPGVSGSMLAISMGIYQKMIDSINNFFDNIKTNFLFLFKIGLGVLISIVDNKTSVFNPSIGKASRAMVYGYFHFTLFCLLNLLTLPNS